MMKNIILSAVFLALMSISTNAQNTKSRSIDVSSTQKGSWLLEMNTGFGNNTSAQIPFSHASNTGFNFFSTDDPN